MELRDCTGSLLGLPMYLVKVCLLVIILVLHRR